jgi:hypothetical protein
MESLAAHRWRKIAAPVLCLMLLLNVAICMMPERPLSRLSDPASASNDPAVAALLNFLRAIHDGNASAVEANLIGGTSRIQSEWILLNNVDLFTSATDAEIFPSGDDDVNQRYFRAQLATAFGRIPVEFRVDKQADGRWLVADVAPTVDLRSQFIYSNSVTIRARPRLTVPVPVPMSLQKSILTRLKSDAFRRQAVADAGLTGIISPALIAQLWAVGWNDDGTELLFDWNGEAQSNTDFVRARMACGALDTALECRARAESAAAVLGAMQLSASQRFRVLKQLLATGDDEIILPTLDRMALVDPQNQPILQLLAAYVRAHPATTALVADAIGYESVSESGRIRGNRYTEVILTAIAARLAENGIRVDSPALRFEISDQRTQAFDRIVLKELRGD